MDRKCFLSRRDQMSMTLGGEQNCLIVILWKDNDGLSCMFRSTVGNVHNLFIIYCNMKLEVRLNVCIKVFSYNLS